MLISTEKHKEIELSSVVQASHHLVRICLNGTYGDAHDRRRGGR